MAFLGAFTARIAFTPAGANETGMAVGDKILLLEKNDGGWWLVHKWVNGQVQRPPGWVPSNYLTEITPTEKVRVSDRGPLVIPIREDGLYDSYNIKNGELTLIGHGGQLELVPNHCIGVNTTSEARDAAPTQASRRWVPQGAVDLA